MHERTGRVQSLHVERSGGVHYVLETDAFFTLEGEQSAIDDALLDACRGRVLDVGAAAGRHPLALQARGMDVTAVDVSPMCVDLMRERGVHHAHEADAWSLMDGPADVPPFDSPFDTVLFGMQSIGITGHVDGLERMLRALARPGGLLAPGGRVLLDSSAPVGPGFSRRIDFRVPGRDAPADPDAWVAGESAVAFSHRGWRGAPFAWLYVGSEALAVVAAECGFSTRVLARLHGSPEFAAVLTRADSGSPPEVVSSAGV